MANDETIPNSTLASIYWMTLGFENFKESDSRFDDADSLNRLWLQSRTSLKFS
jgi:hypothetical protein